MIRYNALILFIIYKYNECLSGIQQKLWYIFTLLIILAAVWIGIIVSIYVIIMQNVKYIFLTSYLASLPPKTYTLTPKSPIYVLQFRIYGKAPTKTSYHTMNIPLNFQPFVTNIGIEHFFAFHYEISKKRSFRK